MLFYFILLYWLVHEGIWIKVRSLDLNWSYDESILSLFFNKLIAPKMIYILIWIMQSLVKMQTSSLSTTLLASLLDTITKNIIYSTLHLHKSKKNQRRIDSNLSLIEASLRHFFISNGILIVLQFQNELVYLPFNGPF